MLLHVQKLHFKYYFPVLLKGGMLSEGSHTFYLSILQLRILILIFFLICAYLLTTNTHLPKISKMTNKYKKWQNSQLVHH